MKILESWIILTAVTFAAHFFAGHLTIQELAAVNFYTALFGVILHLKG